MQNKLQISSFCGDVEIPSIELIETELSQKDHRGANCFWINTPGSDYPSLNILVIGDFAYAHFFPEEGHAGFRSVAEVHDLPEDGEIIFYLSESEEEQAIWNDMVIPFSKAVDLVKEFFEAGELPKTIEWEEL